MTLVRNLDDFLKRHAAAGAKILSWTYRAHNVTDVIIIDNVNPDQKCYMRYIIVWN